MPITAADFKSLIPDPSASLCATFKKWLKLPITLYNFVQQVTDTLGNIAGGLELGDYIYSSSPLAESASRKLANGQELSKAEYPELWAKYGADIYGPSGSGTNFKLPNFSGRFPVVAGTFTNPDTSATQTFTLAQKGGEEIHKLLTAEMPKHRHTGDAVTAGQYGLIRRSGVGEVVTTPDADAAYSGVEPQVGQNPSDPESMSPIPEAGGDTPHNNIPPFLGVYCYVRVK